MLCTIRFIKTSGVKDVETPNGVIRMPIYTGTTYRITNIGMFEDISFDIERIYITEERLEDFEELTVPSPVVVYKVTFSRSPFPEQIMAGRPNNFSTFIPLDEGERLIGLFSAPEGEE